MLESKQARLNETAPLYAVRPRRAFRLGVTGSRNLANSAHPGLRPRLEALLREIATAAATPNAGFSDEPPLLRLLTCLAEGADRLVAQTALAEGWQIHAVLPFPRDSYARDFATPATPGVTPEVCRAEFDCLLESGPTVLELDGMRSPEHGITDRGYEAAGRTVVANCDLLVAIWDGGFPERRGGTAEMVRFAAHRGIPVWWLHTSGTVPPRVLAGPAALRRLREPTAAGAAEAWLTAYLRACFVSPNGHDETHGGHGLIERSIGAWQRLRRRTPGGLDTFLNRPPPKFLGVWSWHAWVRDRAAGKWEAWLTAPLQAADPLFQRAQPRAVRGDRDWPSQSGDASSYWDVAFRAPDAWGNACADRYRTTYVLVIGLIAIALTAALAGLAAPALKLPFTWLEALALLAILLLVGASFAQGWHQRWMDFRLVAELCRKQHHLVAVGWSLPLFHLPASMRGPESGLPWVGWYMNALARAAPLASGVIDATRLNTIRQLAREGLLDNQIYYHARNLPRSRSAALRLGAVAEALFALTCLIVTAKLALAHAHIAPALISFFGLLAALLPVLSAATFAYRAYAEFGVLASQSERMLVELRAADERLAALDTTQPLASQALGMDLWELSTAMLRDVDGWATLFRAKVVEAG